MSRDDAVRAAAVAACLKALRGITPETTDEAFIGALVDAAAPHLTADLEAEVERLRRGWDADVDWANRLLVERDEALDAAKVADLLTRSVLAARQHLTADLVREREALAAECERLRLIAGAYQVATVRAEQAEAAIARAEALCDQAEFDHALDRVPNPVVSTRNLRAALRGDQPCVTCGHESHDDTGCDVGRWTSAPCQCGLRGDQP